MWDEDSLTGAISDIAACQYDGIEMGLGTVQAVGADSLQKQLDVADINLYCVMGEWLESQETADRILRVPLLSQHLVLLFSASFHRTETSSRM